MQRFLTDSLKDWRRWSRIERATALTFVAASALFIPLAMALNLH